MERHLITSYICVAMLLGVMVGCGASDKKPDRSAEAGTVYAMYQGQRARTDSLKVDGLGIQTYDINDDGTADQWHYRTADGLLVRVERDLNFNNRVDMWQYFDDASAIIEEEIDLDLDGKVDVVVFYDENGIVTHKWLALGFDGNAGIQKYYNSRGQLLRLERDENGDGAINVWEYYQDGRRVRIGWDTTLDGMPDTFDNLE